MFKNAVYRIFLILVVVFFAANTYGQRWKLMRYQVGVGIGTSQIFGDIGGSADKNNWYGLKDLSLKNTTLAVGGNLRYKISTLSSVKANLNLGYGSGSDAGSYYERGRSYKATMLEFSGQYEYYILTEEPRHKTAAMFNRRGMINNYSSLSAYLFVGAGVTYSRLNKHNYGTTLASYDDYRSSNIAPVVPFGLGVKFVIDEKWFLGGEFGYRWSSSDYIEGYKQLAGSKYNDMYYFLMFSANRRLKTSRRGIPEFLDRKFK